MDTFEIEGEEVIEREVKATGNGAHVFLPKEWLEDTVKVVRVPENEGLDFSECGVCGRVTTDTTEWCWLDDGGGAFFSVCPTCEAEIEEGPSDNCVICRQDREMSKSDGIAIMGAGEPEWYDACDTCRSRVIFGNTPGANPAWIE